MSATATIDPEVEFVKVEKMLYRLAWKTTTSYPFITFEEARSQACLGFMEAYEHWDPHRGSKFSSWVYFCAWCKLKDLVMFQSRDPLTFIEVDDDLLGEAPPVRAECLEAIEDLSTDAREILDMILETPKELIGEATTPKRFLGRIKDYMVIKKGKKRHQVDAAVKEITIKLREVWGQSCPA